MIREFVDGIIVYKVELLNGRREQHIQIVYNCIGAVELPSRHEKRHSRLSRLCRFFKET